MISLSEAVELAKKRERLHHSLVVGAILKLLAELWGEDQELWERVGILHDIDYPKTKDCKEMHGVKAASELEGKIPVQALQAIKSHDFRTGNKPKSRLDNSLIFADALTHIFSDIDSFAGFQYSEFLKALERVTKNGRPWIKRIILDFINENRLQPSIVERLWNAYSCARAAIGGSEITARCVIRTWLAWRTA